MADAGFKSTDGLFETFTGYSPVMEVPSAIGELISVFLS